MKLCIVSLLVAFACASAAPNRLCFCAQQCFCEHQEGFMQRMYDMVATIPKDLAAAANNMLGAIPIVNILPRMVQGGIYMGDNIAKTADDIGQTVAGVAKTAVGIAKTAVGIGKTVNHMASGLIRLGRQMNGGSGQMNGNNGQMPNNNNTNNGPTPNNTNNDNNNNNGQMPQQEGLMQRMYDVVISIPKGMVTTANNMLGEIPFVNALPQMMQNGLNMGDDMARNADNMVRGITGGGRRRRSDGMDQMRRNGPMPA